MRLPIAIASLAILGACATGPKIFDPQHFQANKQDYVDDHADVSSGGILDESKKVIVPDFKVYFQTRSAGSNSNATFMKSATSTSSIALELQLDQKAMQELTDQAYAKFLKDLTELGYEVIDPPKLAALSPEYKKYVEGDKMKSSPQDIDGQFMEFAPTGMKLELPGQEVKKNTFANFGSSFGTNLIDVVNEASGKLEAISIRPILFVGVGIYEQGSTFSSIDVKAKQGISLMKGTRYEFSEDGSYGKVTLDEPLTTEASYGKLVEATSAVDNIRGVFSFFNSLTGGKQHSSNTYRLEANAEQYKATAWPLIEATQEIFRERMKQEL